MISIIPKLNKQTPTDLNSKVGMAAWIAQMVGMLVIHIVLTGLFIFGAYSFIRIALVADFWLMTVLAILFVGISIMGIAAIIIDICNILFLIKNQ